KRASKKKRSKITLPAWGAAGMSLAMAGGASAAVAPTENTPSQGASAVPIFSLAEEELSDVSLATFYVFDREMLGTESVGTQLARGGGGCGGGGRCGGGGGAGRCGGGGGAGRCGGGGAGRCAAGRCGGGCAAGRCGGGRCAGGCRCGCGGCGVGVV